MEATKQLQSMNMRTGKTKALAKSAKSILLLLAMLVMGQTEAWADAVSLPYSYGFENNNLATDGWTTQNPSDKNSSEFAIAVDAKKTGSYGFRFSSFSSSGVNTQYLISPELNAPNGVELSFAYKASSTSTTGETFKVGYSTTDTSIANFTFGEEISCKSTSWTDYEGSFPAGTKYIAIYYYANYQYRLYVDDFAFTASATGPALAVADGANKVASGYSYNFGLATAGATKTFTLSNPGTESITINIAATNGFGVSPASTTISAKEETALTVTMADVTGAGTVTITPTTGDVDPFIINVSGTIRDPNKVYLDFSDGTIPDGWTWKAIGTYASSYSCSVSEGYISWCQYGGSSYAWAFTSTKLNFEKDELVSFETARYGNSTYYSPSITVEYSTDGSSWTAIGSAFTDDIYSTWTKRSVTIPVDGVKYIRFYGWYIHMRNIYGGELPVEPKMVVTQPASLDYGVINTNTAKTFTIANTGLATLEGINVTSSNAAFAVTGAPASLAAGASKEVTITMSAATKGALSSDITVSATGMENVVFTVKGVVLPDGMNTETFDSGLPTNWTNASWTIADGTATGKSYSAYLTTPKLIFSEGDLLVIKAKRYDSDATDYITVQGSSDNGSTWTAYSKKISGSDGLAYPDYGTIVLSDIPTTVNKLRFVGYYVVVDEISGLTYAPVLSVTTGDPATTVTTPAAYDFGECAANASVTYNFANVGAETINITNVAITGAAAAYSTNWTTSTACPYSLTITRTYDVSRAEAGAQAAVVTVTTSEGAFVINVTGTDKAANAPELAVKLGEDAVTTGDAADFGSKLQAAPAAKTYTITNTGTGTLTGTIATSDDSQFTVSKTSFSLAAAESTTFDVALVFNTTYGTKAATITIHPTIDGLADVVINATASTLDPEAWTEDFAAGTLPMGWVSSSWTIGTYTDYENKTTMALASSTKGTITTPCLIAKKDDVLTWDGYFNWSDVAMTVEYSNDLVTWTKIYDAYKAESDFGSTRYNHKEMSFTAPADGDYYLRFTSTYSNGIDNFAGFKLNLPDHIMNITASSIPTSGSYSPTMKATKSFNATVTVKESRGIAESGVVAKLYMGSTVIGTSDATNFDANESKVINISATPTEAAVDGIEMHIEVEYAGGTLSTTPETRYVAEFVRLDMTENSEPTITTGYSAVYDVVTLTRSFASGWNTFVSPVAVNINDIHAEAIAYSFTGYNEGELSFTKVTTGSLNVATPYIIYVPEAIATKTFTWETPVIYSSYVGEDNIKTTLGGATFQGTYAPIAEGGLTGNYGVTSEGKIQKAGASAKIKGFRAYFKLPAGVTAPSLSVQDQTTGITTIVSEGSQQNGEVYNLNGQKVNAPSKGLYIINGRKVVVK